MDFDKFNIFQIDYINPKTIDIIKSLYNNKYSCVKYEKEIYLNKNINIYEIPKFDNAHYINNIKSNTKFIYLYINNEFINCDLNKLTLDILSPNKYKFIINDFNKNIIISYDCYYFNHHIYQTIK
jgi:hypothetical protein